MNTESKHVNDAALLIKWIILLGIAYGIASIIGNVMRNTM